MGYCTLAQAKTYATNVQGVNVDDLLLDLIESESAEIDKHIGRSLVRAVRVELHNGEGADFLPLNHWPVVDVTAVSVGQVALSPSPSFSAPGFSMSERGVWRVGGRFDRGIRNVLVAYTSGYLPLDYPSDIQLACAELVAYRLNERGRAGQSSKILQGETVQYITKGMPDSVAGRLHHYKSYIRGSS